MIHGAGRHTLRGLGLLAAVLFATFTGCGYKDKPVPPSQIVPNPVADLRVQLGEKGAMLNWSYPSKTVTGGNVPEVSGFALYRAEVPAESFCKNCPIPFAEPISLPGGILPVNGSKTASFEATTLRPGNLYFFKVRSRAGWWIESKDSNIVSFLWNTPPMAPEGLTALSGDNRTTLKWNPVTRYQDTTPMTASVRYQLYRGVGNGALAPLGDPIPETSFVDTKAENGKTYSYQVQAINLYSQGNVSGGKSATVTVTPVDKTPPPVPSGIQGIRTDLGVKVYWEHVEASDLAGYRVYRRIEGENKFVHAGDVQLPYNMFIDQKAPQKKGLYYAVTSIDTQNPANESAKSAEVKVAD